MKQYRKKSFQINANKTVKKELRKLNSKMKSGVKMLKYLKQNAENHLIVLSAS